MEKFKKYCCNKCKSVLFTTGDKTNEYHDLCPFLEKGKWILIEKQKIEKQIGQKANSGINKM